MEQQLVDRLAQHWLEGWNGEDVDLIMSVYAPDVVFTSPFVGMVSGDAARYSIEGYDALYAYVAAALQRTPGIRYTLDGVFAGTDAVVLQYTCYLPNGSVKKGADFMGVDAQGRIVDWRCHYRADSMP